MRLSVAVPCLAEDAARGPFPKPKEPIVATTSVCVSADGKAKQARCLGCSKPARAPSNFCSAKCKAKWQSGINAWSRTLSKDPIDQAKPLF